MSTPPVKGAKIYSKGADYMGRGPKMKAPKGSTAKFLWYHAGIDIVGTEPVRAPVTGRLIRVVKQLPKGSSIFGGYGPQVVAIQDTEGLIHWLAHLEKVQVEQGRVVFEGDIIAAPPNKTKIGHTHYELREALKPYSKEGGAIAADYWPWTVSLDPVAYLVGEKVRGRQLVDPSGNLLKPLRKGGYPVTLGKKEEKSNVITLPDIEIRADQPKGKTPQKKEGEIELPDITIRADQPKKEKAQAAKTAAKASAPKVIPAKKEDDNEGLAVVAIILVVLLLTSRRG